MTTLEILLFAGVLFLACVNTASMVWAFYLDRRLRQKPVPRNYDVHIEGEKVFKEIEINEVEKEAVDDLHAIIAQASERLRAALDDTVQQTTGHIESQIRTAAATQLEAFQNEFTVSLHQSAQQVAGLEQQIEGRRQQLFSAIDAAVEKEYTKRLEIFESKLSDVVAGYILESLGTNANMEGQIETILASLEVHKNDIRQDIQQ